MNIHNRSRAGLAFFFALCGFAAHAQTAALPNAHAHNDYKHKHPLQDAVRYGFTSIEADVFLKRNKFIVAHVSPFLKKANLEDLYLKPFAAIIKEHPGTVYRDYSPPVILLIDIKTDAEKTYAALLPLLQKYAAILTHYESGKVTEGAITIILSGHKPYASLAKETTRYAFIDESLLTTENTKLDKNVCPLTSAKYASIIRWKGNGEMPESERQLLRSYTALAHAQGKKVRLWASPDNKAVWQELLSCGVDLINSDNLEGLSDFLKQRK